ncbi:MAG: exodeoxyribonuclease VII large subunit [Clostridiales bacterium]|nr:exodeoxyribonuclease VII large subunit [Clostridiales bacterium]
MSVPPVLSITQLNAYIKSIIDGDINLNNVFVCGEISNFKDHYRTGHYYLTLKDEKAAIRAVMFRTANQRIKFKPENGMSVIARGRISVFERDGQYQLYIDDMQPDGLGALNLAFEQLKNKLAGEGLFDACRKREIPKYPRRIGVITSPTGAAVQDIINILTRRFPIAQIIKCPVQVQGASAAPQIVDAIKRFNTGHYADVLIVGRGGGSIEELWAFNEETVARAVANSKIPVISAVGHETDFTICDFVADLRAPTPSAAAELAVPDKFEQRTYISALKYRVAQVTQREIQQQRAGLKSIESSMGLISPVMVINTHRQRLDGYIASLYTAVASTVSDSRSALAVLGSKLDTLSPLKVLGRGYALAYKKGSLLHDDANADIGGEIEVRLEKGRLLCTVEKISV